jgi:tetratricopeptide (TPR) repeat protein
MGEGRGAVFLSYASQDAEAAQRITDAMRAAGVEVWFDQSELRGGDAWDQNIRRQIRECALFVPVISANTNARAEGYFRLEWKLAVDRSHLMADDEPFLFPIAIDAVPEREARVPDRFREVQWMRLGKDSPEAIAARAAKLLAGEASPAMRRADTPRRRIRSAYVWPFVGIAIAAFFITMPQWRTPKRERAAPAAIERTRPAQASDPVQLSKRAVDLTRKLNFTREDLIAGGDLARKASELEPTLAMAWGARARVEYSWVNRYWDTSDARRKAAQDHAKRALALDPDEPSALWTHGNMLVAQGALKEAEATFTRALKAWPDDNYIRGSLTVVYHRQGRAAEAFALREEMIRRDPRNPLPYVGLSYAYANPSFVKDRNPANIDIALAHLERSIEAHPTAGALNWKASSLAAWKGDFRAALAALDRVASLPHEEATEDRSIYLQMWVAMLAGEPERALAAASRTTSTYFHDQIVPCPVAWMKALAHRQARRQSAAAEEWRAAEAVLRARLAAAPDSLATQAELAITLAMLGRKEEAAKQFARYDAAMRDTGQAATASHVRFHAAMRDGKRTADALREVRKPMPLWFTDIALERDPWYDGVRDQPPFQALLRERLK